SQKKRPRSSKEPRRERAPGPRRGFELFAGKGEANPRFDLPAPPRLTSPTTPSTAKQNSNINSGALRVPAAKTLHNAGGRPDALGFLAVAVVGGCLIELGLQLVIAALVFRFVSVGALHYLIDDVFNNFGNYPLSVFGGGVRFLLTFGLPLAFVAYLPS